MPRASQPRRAEKEQKAPRGRSAKKKSGPARAAKERATAKPGKERKPARRRAQARAEPKTGKRRAVPRADQERVTIPKRPVDEEDLGRLAAEELAGESEYSMHEAQHDERGSTHRKKRDTLTDEPLTVVPDPDELGRRFLEDATEAPSADFEEDEEEPLLYPHEPE
ncbi:MAG TPA: hypothetical protein VIL20_07480 [Sandaracinaceae bacterium]